MATRPSNGDRPRLRRGGTQLAGATVSLSSFNEELVAVTKGMAESSRTSEGLVACAKSARMRNTTDRSALADADFQASLATISSHQPGAMCGAGGDPE